MLGPGLQSVASATSNLGLVSTMGPLLPTASVHLASFRTITVLTVLLKTQPRDRVDDRVDAFLADMLHGTLPDDCHVSVSMHHDFPMECGVSSSASGFAALVQAAAKLVGKGDDNDWIQNWSRIGSNAAILSSVAGETDDHEGMQLVSRTGQRATTHPLGPRLATLEHMLVVCDPLVNPSRRTRQRTR